MCSKIFEHVYILFITTSALNQTDITHFSEVLDIINWRFIKFNQLDEVKDFLVNIK